MIPVRLKLRNFMSYREDVPPLDFTGIQLACICGENGNGKSSLIDAMTWALWGRARASQQDELIHTTATETEVELDFKVGQRLYRVIRKHARSKGKGYAGASSLDFMVASDGGFKVLNGDNILQTEARIREALNMDYETFINSAYLRQGRADEFTRQPPARRKEVLGNILGLEYYERLESQAKESARRLEASREQLEISLREISAEIGRRPLYEAELTRAQDTLTRVDTEVKEKENALNELRRKKDELERVRSQAEGLRSQFDQLEHDRQRWEEQARQNAAKLRRYEETINRREEIENGYRSLREVKRQFEELDRRFRQTISLEKQKEQVERLIEQKRHELLREHSRLQDRLERLDRLAADLPARREELSRVLSQKQELEAKEAGLTSRRSAASELQNQLSHLEAEKGRLDKEIKEIAEKLDLIRSGREEAKCPLCERELTEHTRRLIETKYATESHERHLRQEKLIAEISQAKLELQAWQQEIAEAESNLRLMKERCLSREGEIRTRIKEIEDETGQIPELRAAQQKIEHSLATGDFAAAEGQKLAAIAAAIAGIAYDPQHHEAARQQADSLQHYESEMNRLEEALKYIDQERDSAATIARTIEDVTQRQEKIRQEKQQLESQLTALPGLLAQVSTAEAEYRRLIMQRSQAQEAVGAAREKIRACNELEAKKQEKEKELQEVSRDEMIYRELATAFGKSGVQALLIETALPEIENEANKLLSLMTDNRMHLKFETQKETRKGSVQETLNISISDELGTRDYEMFSGGEAFRIDLAIRIALSRLLARRAGAPLATLIIDEGFGTQDSAALEKIKETIVSIRDEFEKILVITHVEELKDAFPTRIEVVKTSRGSTFTVI